MIKQQSKIDSTIVHYTLDINNLITVFFPYTTPELILTKAEAEEMIEKLQILVEEIK